MQVKVTLQGAPLSLKGQQAGAGRMLELQCVQVGRRDCGSPWSRSLAHGLYVTRLLGGRQFSPSERKSRAPLA